MGNDLSIRRILWILLAVVLILAMSAMIYFKVVQINDAKAALAAENEALRHDRERLGRLEALKRDEAALKEKYEAAVKMMPEEPSEDTLILYLGEITDAAKIRFTNIKFKPRVQTGKFTGMPAEFSVAGDYKALVRLLEMIKNGERAIRIDSMTVRSSIGGSFEIEADLTAHGFYMTQ